MIEEFATYKTRSQAIVDANKAMDKLAEKVETIISQALIGIYMDMRNSGFTDDEINAFLATEGKQTCLARWEDPRNGIDA